MAHLWKTWFRGGLAALLANGLFVGAALAGPFSNLFVFGDSLSDVGNVSQATAAILFIPTVPGPHYYNGRFSNGPVYTELLATELGLPTMVHSRSGGNNFAHGGALTSGTSFPTSIVVRDVDDQVGDYLASVDGAADANALFVVFAGANDLLDTEIEIDTPVDNLAEDIGRLIAAGARQFLVPNLPLLGKTPRFNGDEIISDAFNMRTGSYNDLLDDMLDELEMSESAPTVFRLDVAGLFDHLIDYPAEYGLTNVTQSAAPGLEPGDTSYNTNLIAPNEHEYLFWDNLHPTATVHAALAQAALEVLLELPGDFNHDGTVDTADYIVWRSGLGTTYAEDDYDTWRGNFGATSGSAAGGDTIAAVPEPSALSLCAFAIVLLCAGRFSDRGLYPRLRPGLSCCGASRPESRRRLCNSVVHCHNLASRFTRPTVVAL